MRAGQNAGGSGATSVGITIADDVLAEMERMRAKDGLGPSAALHDR